MNLLNVMTLSNGRVQDKKFKSFKTNVWSSIKAMERRNFSQMIFHFLTIWKILKRILSWQSKFNVFAGVPSYTFTPSPFDWNSSCRGVGLPTKMSLPKRVNKKRSSERRYFALEGLTDLLMLMPRTWFDVEEIRLE